MLRDDHVLIADSMLKTVGRILGRRQFTTNSYVTNLLRRNMMVARESDVLVVVGRLEKTAPVAASFHSTIGVCGGTAWACQAFATCAADRMRIPGALGPLPLPLFFYVQNGDHQGAWMRLVVQHCGSIARYRWEKLSASASSLCVRELRARMESGSGLPSLGAIGSRDLGELAEFEIAAFVAEMNHIWAQAA